MHVADLRVSPEGLRATAGTLGEPTAQFTPAYSGSGSQTSVATAQSIGTRLSGWDTDESGYHVDMADALTAASAGFETTDEQGGQSIAGVM